MTSQDDLPMVSIVTPSLNQGRFIRDTIESVPSQDYPRLECIVMDGGSTDETIGILRSYGDWLLWKSALGQGLTDAINSGVRLATGEILGWVNSDDTYQPGAVKEADGLDRANLAGSAGLLERNGGSLFRTRHLTRGES